MPNAPAHSITAAAAAAAAEPRLSQQQNRIVDATGNIFLRACPGSGKTRVVSARVERLAREGHKVAMISYTRVGASEISAAVNRHSRRLLSADHFVGTLHSFLLTYVLRPFGHLITKSPVTMQISPADAATFSPKDLVPEHFSYDVNARLSRKYRKPVRASEIGEMSTAKREAARSGYVNYDDAVYACMRVLARYPNIAAALALRFDEIIVDEAQDTTEMQLACLGLIAKAGLRSLVLVGDYDQSIYAFSGASPTACQKLADRLKLTDLSLTENYRSSQAICDVSASFRGDKRPDAAVGQYAELGIPPQLLFYSPDELGKLVPRFKVHALNAGARPQTHLILTRKRELRNALLGVEIPDLPSPLQVLIEAKSADALTFENYLELEQLLLRSSVGSRATASEIGRLAVRDRVTEMITSLPELTGDLASWCKQAMRVFGRTVAQISPSSSKTLPVTIKKEWARLNLKSYGDSRAISEVVTIHKSKGRSIDAVMLVAQQPNESWHSLEAAQWSSGVGSSRVPDSEEVRLAYVALTRARQLFVLALPVSTPNEIKQRFVSIGFRL